MNSTILARSGIVCRLSIGVLLLKDKIATWQSMRKTTILQEPGPKVTALKTKKTSPVALLSTRTLAHFWIAEPDIVWVKGMYVATLLWSGEKVTSQRYVNIRGVATAVSMIRGPQDTGAHFTLTLTGAHCMCICSPPNRVLISKKAPLEEF
ncbi:hypothetical protein TNCV_4503651 [Trichonephila clavipes]|nr:hypothetical protein TNCV_4503651 [Trichonephila clavipes]